MKQEAETETQAELLVGTQAEIRAEIRMGTQVETSLPAAKRAEEKAARWILSSPANRWFLVMCRKETAEQRPAHPMLPRAAAILPQEEIPA